ncbi:50S ribosomal protein L11 [Candidatus Woesearchaeota archaeon]|nr:50S ribosomal protein L11 [Candidatus Woesearchaeota archaeon]
MGTEIVEVLIEGGKATPAPPLGSQLGPLKVNVKAIVEEINKKTSAFKGMKVPVKIEVDTNTKEFKISIGTPPASQLIKTELGIKSGSGEPNKYKVALLTVEQIIKIAKMKINSLNANNLKSAVKIIAGSCHSMGVLIEGMTGSEFVSKVNGGVYDKEISSGLDEIPKEKLEQFAAARKDIEKKLVEILKQKAATKAAEAAKTPK